MNTGKILSVVIPVYNEQATILRIIEKVRALDFVMEVIVVDDGSTDGTGELLKQTLFDDRVRLFFHDRNRGKGAALRTGSVPLVHIDYNDVESTHAFKMISVCSER